MRELDMEERRLKLEEDHLKFEHEKWLMQQQQQQQPGNIGARQYDSQVEPAGPPVQVGTYHNLQPVHSFAADDMDPRHFEHDSECVLDLSEY